MRKTLLGVTVVVSINMGVIFMCYFGCMSMAMISNVINDHVIIIPINFSLNISCKIYLSIIACSMIPVDFWPVWKNIDSIRWRWRGWW